MILLFKDNGTIEDNWEDIGEQDRRHRAGQRKTTQKKTRNKRETLSNVIDQLRASGGGKKTPETHPQRGGI